VICDSTPLFRRFDLVCRFIYDFVPRRLAKLSDAHRG
jgi:hypothetical protein